VVWNRMVFHGQIRSGRCGLTALSGASLPGAGSLPRTSISSSESLVLEWSPSTSDRKAPSQLPVQAQVYSLLTPQVLALVRSGQLVHVGTRSERWNLRSRNTGKFFGVTDAV
jgi:hypothetical protein